MVRVTPNDVPVVRDFLVRDAAPADLPEVSRIFAHYVATSAATFAENALSVDEWRERLDAVNRARLPFLVAAGHGDERRLLGYAYCRPWRTAFPERSAYRHTVEDTVYVTEEAVGQGVGRALLDGLLRRCVGAGIREVVAVIADTGQPASAALHQRCGFVQVGRLSKVGFKRGRWWDTQLWQRSLPDGRAAAHPARRSR